MALSCDANPCFTFYFLIPLLKPLVFLTCNVMVDGRWIVDNETLIFINRLSLPFLPSIQIEINISIFLWIKTTVWESGVELWWRVTRSQYWQPAVTHSCRPEMVSPQNSYQHLQCLQFHRFLLFVLIFAVNNSRTVLRWSNFALVWIVLWRTC